MNYVIIGNSHAAVGAIEGIRSVDKTGVITVISKEPYPVYGRPLISYYLCGKTTPEKMAYRPADFYEKNGVTLLLGKRAVGADSNTKTVTLDDGSTVPYDRLLFACGSNPTIIPFPGLDGVKDRFTFTTFDDALALEKVLAPEKRVLIVGAGLIGLKCAEGIRDRVGSITVCDLADRVLATILDAECAAPVAEVLRDAGIDFLPGDTVDHFDGNTAHMKSGKVLDFDILVLAIGVRPNTALAADMGAAVNRGILIDAGSRTSLPDVYAAGDCAEGFDASFGQNRVLAILPSAYLEGHAAGVNMAGGSESFEKDIPMNSIGFFGLHIISAGSYIGKCRVVGSGAHMKRFYVSDNRLNGFIAIGDIDRAGIYTGLIRDKVDLSTLDFDRIIENPMLAAFGKSARDAKLTAPI